MRKPLQGWNGLTEKARQERNQNSADQGHATASHQLLHALGLGTRVIIAITFQKIDRSPDSETGTEGDNEGLKDRNGLIEKCHNI